MPTFARTRADSVVAADLLIRYFTEREQTFPSTQGSYTVRLPDPERFVPPAGDFVVASIDGVPSGCGGVRRLDDAVARDGAPVVVFEVKHLWLDPATRGRGAGRALLAELERRAVALGAERLVLDTNESLEAAGHLYRTSGYVDVPPYNDNPNATNWYAKEV
jgi:GNAT superfamily N-acetyltransferase